MTNFLDSTKMFPRVQWPKRENEISNWLKVSKVIYATEDKNLVLRYLQLELMTRNRSMVTQRMYARYSYLRNAIEFDEITKTFVEGTPSKADLAILHSWDYTVPHLKNIDFDEDGEIMRLMQSEWQSARRHYLLKRLLTRFQSRRRRLELKEMQKWNRRKQQSSIYESV